MFIIEKLFLKITFKKILKLYTIYLLELLFRICAIVIFFFFFHFVYKLNKIWLSKDVHIVHSEKFNQFDIVSISQ